MIVLWHRQLSPRILAKIKKFLFFPSNAKVYFQQGTKKRGCDNVWCQEKKKSDKSWVSQGPVFNPISFSVSIMVSV